MNEQRKPRPPGSVWDTLTESQADLAKGQWENLDSFLEQMDRRIDERAAEIEQKNAGRPASP